MERRDITNVRAYKRLPHFRSNTYWQSSRQSFKTKPVAIYILLLPILPIISNRVVLKQGNRGYIIINNYVHKIGPIPCLENTYRETSEVGRLFL